MSETTTPPIGKDPILDAAEKKLEAALLDYKSSRIASLMNKRKNLEEVHKDRIVDIEKEIEYAKNATTVPCNEGDHSPF